MTVQLDLFECNSNESLRKREVIDKLTLLANGKHLRGLKGNRLAEAHDKKWGEIFKEDEAK